MNNKLSNYLCEFECDDEIRNAVKYRLNIDPYEIATESIASTQNNMLDLINSVVSRTLEVWRKDYRENSGEYYANVIYTALKPELYYSNDYLSSNSSNDDCTKLLEQYFQKVLPWGNEYFITLKNYIMDRLKNRKQSASQYINSAYNILCHVLDGYNEESIEDKNAFYNYLKNYNKGQNFVACAIKETDGFGSDRKLSEQSIEFAKQKECELYTDMVARNILQIYLCRIYSAPIRFSKSSVSNLYNKTKVKNALYAGYNKSCIRELLYGKCTNGERFTHQALCFPEYSAMKTTLFTRYNKKKIMDEFYNIVREEVFVDDNNEVSLSDELKQRLSAEYCDKLCVVVKGLYSLDYEASNDEIEKAIDLYYKDITDIVIKNHSGWDKDFCFTNFNSLCFRLHSARTDILIEFENKLHSDKLHSDRDISLLLQESEYMIERLYGINSIRSELAKSSERVDSDKILDVMRLQNIHLRNIYLNMKIEKDRLREFVSYEADFLYPLIMYMVQCALEVYMDSKKTCDIIQDEKKQIEIQQNEVVYSLYNLLKDKYYMDYKIREYKNVKISGSENAIDRVYKSLWKRYEVSDFENTFNKNIRNTTDNSAAKETVRIWLQR